MGGNALGQQGQALPLLVHPFVKMAGHEFAGIGVARFQPLLPAHGFFKALHITHQGAGHQAHAVAVHLQDLLTSGLGQRRTQHRQGIAKAVAAGGQVGIGPDLVDQGFARMGLARRQREAGQQQGAAPPAQLAQHPPTHLQLGGAQQAQLRQQLVDVVQRCHGSSRRGNASNTRPWVPGIHLESLYRPW